MEDKPLTTEAAVSTNQPKSPQYARPRLRHVDRRRWLVDQLRAAGVPNNVLARVVLSDLEEDWQKRLEEGALKDPGNPDTMAALHLEQEKDTEAEMRTALGEEGFKSWDQGNLLREVNLGKISFQSAAETNADL